MLKIPALSAPLTKAIRTAEGVLVYLITAGLATTAAIDPSRLSPKEAAILATVNGGLLNAQRLVLKGIALFKGIGVGDPIPFDPVPVEQISESASELVDAGVEIEQVIKPETAARPYAFTGDPNPPVQ